MTDERNIADEIKQGLEEAKLHKQKKITLKSEKLFPKEKLEFDPNFIKDVRERLNLSQAVFAAKLRISSSTLKKWEQGVSEPNEQAITLIHLLEKYPDMLNRLENL